MVSGNVLMQKLQLGREATAGEAVVATAVWPGVGVPKDDREIRRPQENIGIQAPSNRSYTPFHAGSVEFGETELDFDTAFHIFEAAIKTIGTGEADGAGTDKIYAYTLPTGGSANTIKFYTIEGGDDIQAREMAYCYVEQFEIVGEPNEAIMISATWRGRVWANTTYTGSLVRVDGEIALTNKTKLYIDAVAGTLGATQISETMLSFKYTVKTGWVSRPTGDGNLYFGYAKYDPSQVEVTLEMKFEHDSKAETQLTAFEAETRQQVQLVCEGSQVATPGTTYTFLSLIIDIAGVWTDFSELGDDDGNSVIDVTMIGAYDSVAALFSAVTMITEVTAVP